MDNEKYFLEYFSKSYENWGKGIDREVYMRAFLDGYKTAMAVAFTIADNIIDKKMEEQRYADVSRLNFNAYEKAKTK